MQTVTYAAAQSLWADLCGLDGDNLLTVDAARFARAFNRAIRVGWEWQWWPDLMLVEERFFRLFYAGATTYAAPTATTASEVFFPANRKYYQALRATTGNAPAALAAGAYTVNAAYWAECAFSYAADDWAASTAYAAGNSVRNPDDDRTYACHAAHTSGTTFDATKFGLLTPFVPYVGWDQAGKTALGTVRECYEQNPRTSANRARRVPWEPDELGVRCTAAAIPDRCWIEFRQRCSTFTAVATNVPAFLMDFAVHGAKIAFLEGDGQLDKALANSGSALWDHLFDEADKLMASAQNRPRRTRVANV